MVEIYSLIKEIIKAKKEKKSNKQKKEPDKNSPEINKDEEITEEQKKTKRSKKNKKNKKEKKEKKNIVVKYGIIYTLVMLSIVIAVLFNTTLSFFSDTLILTANIKYYKELDVYYIKYDIEEVNLNQLSFEPKKGQKIYMQYLIGDSKRIITKRYLENPNTKPYMKGRVVETTEKSCIINFNLPKTANRSFFDAELKQRAINGEKFAIKGKLSVNGFKILSIDPE